LPRGIRGPHHFLILSLSKDGRMLVQANKHFQVARRLDHHAASFDKLRMRKMVGPSSSQHRRSGWGRSCGWHRCGAFNLPHPELVEGRENAGPGAAKKGRNVLFNKCLDQYAASFDRLRMRKMVGSTGVQHGCHDEGDRECPPHRPHPMPMDAPRTLIPLLAASPADIPANPLADSSAPRRSVPAYQNACRAPCPI
jgi:hypothetical protein